MDLWLKNGTGQTLTGLRTQICAMLKRARGFSAQTADNKQFGPATASVQAGDHRIAIQWERCGRTWGNPQCPCMHSDPVLPDCPPGVTVRVTGRLQFT